MILHRDDPASDQPRPPKPITREWLFRAAAHYLERYSSSTANLRRVLERKVMRRAHARGEDAGSFAELIDEIVARFVELKLVDDRAYGEARVLSLRRRGTSTRMVAAKLSEKGVERDLVEELLAADETSDRQAALAYAKRRRLGPYRLRNRAERRDRDVAAMVRAGFGFADAAAAIDGEPDQD
ncbi:RecX family transcriptional regulator [Aurantimonas sp. A2-1-M11]|uniref:regulatory protein RecX n=1 Tax=Aurantimonas sp. A2-1-M11 TaxID=3113712 RepID=UPI002F93E659